VRAVTRLALAGTLAFAASASAQAVMVRADAAVLNPDTARTLHAAYDLGAGIDFGGHYTLLVDYVRQNFSGQTSGYGASWVTLIGGAFEYTLGDWQLNYRRQFTLGLRGGMMQPHAPFLHAPYFGFAVGFKYPVAKLLRFDGRFEDVLAFPPRQTATFCDAYNVCFTRSIGGSAQQNFGIFLGFELHGVQ